MLGFALKEFLVLLGAISGASVAVGYGVQNAGEGAEKVGKYLIIPGALIYALVVLSASKQK